jgi:hypothetical protein
MPRTNLSSQFDSATIKATKARIVKRNTFARQEGDETVIRLHGTDIVRKRANGSVVLNSAGWKTVTTKDRMNDHMPAGFMLQQEKGQWYVGKGWGDENRVPYFDGFVVPDDYAKPRQVGAKVAKKEDALRKQIRKFVCDVPLKGPFPEPSNGDCWYCRMQTKDGKSLGDAIGDTEHIRAHIKERYMFGSLLVNAMRWAGRRRPEILYQMGAGDLVRRDLKRYLYRQCGLVS